MNYYIKCLQNAPLSSWDEPYTKDEIVEKFMDYARNEWEEVPPKKWFSLANISEMWEVEFVKVKE